VDLLSTGQARWQATCAAARLRSRHHLTLHLLSTGQARWQATCAAARLRSRRHRTLRLLSTGQARRQATCAAARLRSRHHLTLHLLSTGQARWQTTFVAARLRSRHDHAHHPLSKPRHGLDPGAALPDGWNSKCTLRRRRVNRGMSGQRGCLCYPPRSVAERPVTSTRIDVCAQADTPLASSMAAPSPTSFFNFIRFLLSLSTSYHEYAPGSKHHQTGGTGDC